MWKYDSQIGALYIKRLPDNRYGFIFNNVVWESSHSPEAEADNIRSFTTGCYEWDSMEGLIDYPNDISEWQWLQDPQ